MLSVGHCAHDQVRDRLPDPPRVDVVHPAVDVGPDQLDRGRDAVRETIVTSPSRPDSRSASTAPCRGLVVEGHQAAVQPREVGEEPPMLRPADANRTKREDRRSHYLRCLN